MEVQLKYSFTPDTCIIAWHVTCVQGLHALLLLGLGLCLMPLTGFAASLPHTGLATACDHRHGVVATWSQATDTAQTNSMFYAEACGFKFNITLCALCAFASKKYLSFQE